MTVSNHKVWRTEGDKDRLPNEFEVPQALWRQLTIGSRLGHGEQPIKPDAKFYATIHADGSIFVRGPESFDVPLGNPFAQDFYEYLNTKTDLPPQLRAIQVHPIVARIIGEVSDNVRRSVATTSLLLSEGYDVGAGRRGGGGH